MGNAIEACKRAGAKLVFFDNVYMYGRVSGPMTEETPFNPCHRSSSSFAVVRTSCSSVPAPSRAKAPYARSTS
jgi:hypothetical protein